MPRKSLNEVIREIAVRRPHDDPRRLAMDALKDINTDDLTALLADAIECAQRHISRDVERSAFTDLFADKSGTVHIPNIETSDSLKTFLALLSTRFSTGDGEIVTWGDATIAHHQRRISFLENMRGGITETIERHHNAIKIIRDRDVECLNETYQEAA